MPIPPGGIEAAVITVIVPMPAHAATPGVPVPPTFGRQSDRAAGATNGIRPAVINVDIGCVMLAIEVEGTTVEEVE